MNCDVEKLYKTTLNSLPNEVGIQEFLISAETLRVPSNFLSTDKLCIVKTVHEYDSLRVDKLLFYANKRTYRALGLLIFAGLFSEQSESTLQLTSTHSDITSIKIKFDKPGLKDVFPGFTAKPFAFSYWPVEVQIHPWLNLEVHDFELPSVILTDHDSNTVPGKGNIVEGFGADRGAAMFAELLLNIGRPENNCDRVELECDPNYKGVCFSSAEVSLNIVANE